MQILPINYSVKILQYKTVNSANYPTPVITAPLSADTVCFKGVIPGDAPIKQLLRYGIYDMYTGRRLLDPKDLESLLQKSIFRKPLAELLPILSKKEDTLNEIDLAILNEFRKIGKKNPQLRLDEAIKLLKPEHEKKLLKIQQPVFEELIEKACDLPEKMYTEFMKLMTLTNKRIARDPVVMPFSAKELIYKLKRVQEEIKSKNNPVEIREINKLIKSAKLIFETYNMPKHQRGKRKLSRDEKLINQMQKDVLKRNTMRFNVLRDIFEQSSIRNNQELRHIFKTTSAKVHGFPAIVPFKRKEFEYDLKAVLRGLKDRKLHSEMIQIAHKLPTSIENVSAFIVKYSEDSPSKIGFSLLKNSICSVDHMLAKNIGGKNIYENYGLCSVYINHKKTNIPFDEWCEMHPETRKNCQKYVDRMIELYNNGTFKKVGLERSYITNFANTVQQLSPEKNPLILDLSKLQA